MLSCYQYVLFNQEVAFGDDVLNLEQHYIRLFSYIVEILPS